MVNQYCAHSFARNWQLPFLNQRKGENDRRKYFMINLHERMLPTSAGVEPATSWSPVGRRIQLSHQGRPIHCYNNFKVMWFPPETNMVQTQVHDTLLQQLQLYDSHQTQTIYKHRCMISCYNNFKVIWFLYRINQVQTQLNDIQLQLLHNYMICFSSTHDNVTYATLHSPRSADNDYQPCKTTATFILHLSPNDWNH